MSTLISWFLVGGKREEWVFLIIFCLSFSSWGRKGMQERNVCKGHKSSLSEKEETLWLLHQHNIIWNIRRWYTRQTGKKEEDEKERKSQWTPSEKDMQYVNYAAINYTRQVIMNIQNKQLLLQHPSLSHPFRFDSFIKFIYFPLPRFIFLNMRGNFPI